MTRQVVTGHTVCRQRLEVHPNWSKHNDTATVASFVKSLVSMYNCLHCNFYYVAITGFALQQSLPGAHSPHFLFFFANLPRLFTPYFDAKKMSNHFGNPN